MVKKRGLRLINPKKVRSSQQDIIVTVLLVLIAILAVVIVGVFISSFVKHNIEETRLKSEASSIDLEIKELKLLDNDANASVKIYRNPNLLEKNAVLDSIRFMFQDKDGNFYTYVDNAIASQQKEMETKTYLISALNLTPSLVNFSNIVYLEISSGIKSSSGSVVFGNTMKSNWGNKISVSNGNTGGKTCTLTNAYWSSSNVNNGVVVNMIVNGANCVGKQINFSIYEDDLIGDTYMESVVANYNSGAWTSRWIDDGLLQGDPEYYFVASEIGNEANHIQSNNELSVSAGFSSQEIIPSDRRINWSGAGIPGGIPVRTTICATINSGTYGDGVTDATNAIQTAINSCPVNQVVYLPEGTYKVSNKLNINKGIVLRGAGPEKTKIISSSSSQALMVDAGARIGYIDILSGYGRGSKSMTLALNSVSGWPVSVGSYLVIDQENSDNSTTIIPTGEGSEGPCPYCGNARCSTNHSIYCSNSGPTYTCDNGKGICEGGYRSVGQIVKITSMNGNTINFEPELYWNYTMQGEPRVLLIYPNSMIEYVGLEDFYISGGSGNTMEINGCSYCWAKNIESNNTNQRHYHASMSYKNEIRDSYFHGAQCYIGDYGYGVSLASQTTDTLVENNVFDWIHDGVAQSVGGGGNVISYNYFAHQRFDWPVCSDISDEVMPSITNHGRHPAFNLFEGNVGEAFWSDYIHGEASHTTIYRNKLTGYFSYANMNFPESNMTSRRALWPIVLAKYSRYFNVLGNVLGTLGISDGYEISDTNDPNCWYDPFIYFLGYEGIDCSSSKSDPGVKQTLLRHGNFDYYNNAIIWDSSITNHSLPASLYLNSKPSWWTPGLTWPAIGPDPSNPSQLLNGKIPAQVRYESMMNITTPVCGNNKTEAGEICDLNDLNGKTCLSLGYNGGSLSCNLNCLSYNTANCIGSSNILLNPFADSSIQDEGGLNRDERMGSYLSMGVGGRNQNVMYRILIRFNLSSVPNNAIITNANLKLYHKTNNVQGTNVNNVNVYRVLRDWSELGVTWNNYTSSSVWTSPGANSIGNDRDNVLLATRNFTSSTIVNQYYGFDVTNAVQNYVNGSYNNYGFILIGKETPNSDRYFSGFDTKEAPNPPILDITYTVGGSQLPSSVGVNVDGSIEHQTIEGFGGQMESHPEYENDGVFWDLLFNEVGVSAVRIGGAVGIYPNIPTEQVEHLPVLREAKNHNVSVFSLGQSPRPEWKKPNQTNGGTLLSQYYDDFAYLILDYINHIENVTGIKNKYVLPIAEPSLGYNADPNSPFNHCYMAAENYTNLLKVLGPIFRAQRPDLKISAPCDWNTQISYNYASVILADPNASQYVDVISSNGYGWPVYTNPQSWQNLYNLAKQYNKTEFWVPEAAHCVGCQNPMPDAAGIYISKWIYEALVYGNVGVWETWLMIDKGSHSSDMRGFVYSDKWPPGEFTSTGITKNGYAFRQFAHWIRPGAVRINASSNNQNVLVSAYKNSVNNTFTLITINDAKESKTVSFIVHNLNPITNLKAYRTSATENSTNLGSISVTGNSFNYTLPAESITTFSGTI